MRTDQQIIIVLLYTIIKVILKQIYLNYFLFILLTEVDFLWVFIYDYNN